jgi:hypothetical protein
MTKDDLSDNLTRRKKVLSSVLEGLDENGEPIHSSQYHHMWCNGPYEAYQYPDYPFEQHFGQQTPSFPPGAAMKDYLEGIIVIFFYSTFQESFNENTSRFIHTFKLLRHCKAWVSFLFLHFSVRDVSFCTLVLVRRVFITCFRWFIEIYQWNKNWINLIISLFWIFEPVALVQWNTSVHSTGNQLTDVTS